MTENQEQNLKSVDTQEKPSIVVEPLATPYRAIFPADKEMLQKAFDVFWETHGDLIIQQSGYKGKKRKGGKVNKFKARKSLEASYGISKMYQTPIAACVEEVLNGYYADDSKKVLFLSNVQLQNWESEEPFVVSIFHFWPKLHFDQNLHRSLERQIPRDVNKALEGRLMDLQNKYKSYVFTEDDKLNSEMEVLIDIIASIDGTPYEDGTVRKAWYKVGDMLSTELRDAILAHKKGDLFETTFSNPIPGDKKDIEIAAHIKIYESRYVKLLPTDSLELYEKEGFESKEAFLEKFTEEYDNYMTNSERHYAFDSIINQITLGGKLDPVPQRWIDLNVQYMMTQHAKHFKGDVQASMEAVGAQSEEQYKNMFESQVLKDTINQMAVACYAQMFDLPDDPEKVADHILENVFWVEPS
jgi:FKBP-type peptidyl-prolyl cis-trans isomerase (trigger factor)